MEYNVPMAYCLIRNVKDPEYGTPSAGCIDFFVPVFDEAFMKALAEKNPALNAAELHNISVTKIIPLSHGEDINIPSGVKVRLEPHTALTAFNKSGVATKLRLIRGAEYVDCDYTGEIHLHVINAGKKTVNITEGQKLVQFSYVPVLTAQLNKFDNPNDMYDGFQSQRGEKWQGSTGTH